MAFTTISKTQKEFLIDYLRGTNKELSPAQAESLFGIKNLSARMSEIREDGFKVRTRKNTTGSTSYAVSRRKIGQV